MIAWLVLLQTTLTIAVSGPATNPEYWPLRVAESEGYFAQERLSVSLETTRAETGAAEALARGHVDLAATSLDAALLFGHVGGGPPRLVFGLTAAPPVVLLVPAAQKDAIRGLPDLVGKTIGVPAPGTPAQLALLSLLAKAGIPVLQVTVKSYGERGLAGALGSAEVAAAVLGDPYATRLSEEGKAVALVDLRKRGDAAQWLGGPTVHAAIFARADTALGSAQLVPLARALLRAMARIEAAPPEELQTKLPAATVGFPEDFALSLRGARQTFLTDGWVSLERLKESVALVRSRTPIPPRVRLPRRIDGLLLTDPLKAALNRNP